MPTQSGAFRACRLETDASQSRRSRLRALFGVMATIATAGVLAQSDFSAQTRERLEELERRQREMDVQLEERDVRIRALETEIDTLTSSRADVVDDYVETGSREPPVSKVPAGDKAFGIFQTGARGFKLADTPHGDLNFSAWAYVRYLDQRRLEDTYTDSFGRTFDVEQRHDIQLNKVNLYFKGWVYDPDFRYLLYAWTANTSQGEPAQVVIAGNLNYRFNDALDVGAGIAPLPGVRSLRGNFPYWLRVDQRPIADEFFRPSYTTGIWASGKLASNLHYKVMLGNNLSQLGVSAEQLDANLNTLSGSLWWTPRGEYGPAGGFGDFEYHEFLATTFGVQATHSREDRQSQPDTEAIENSQLRLSDGTIIFQPRAFDTDGRIDQATYYMTSIDAGLKYRGWSLEGEYYFRWLNDFDVQGTIPVSELFDHGFQLQGSTMLLPRKLQAYLTGSYIFGEYGEPWDVSVGANWFPFRERLVRLNAELLYLDRSPVGYSSVPFVVGGTGLVFQTNLEMAF